MAAREEPVDRVMTGLGHRPGRRRSMARSCPVVGRRPRRLRHVRSPTAPRRARARLCAPSRPAWLSTRSWTSSPSITSRRLRGLLAVLTRVGLDLPAGLAPAEPTDCLRAVARDRPDARPVEGEGRQMVRTELEVVAGAPSPPWLPWSGAPKARPGPAGGWPPAGHLGPAIPQRRPAHVGSAAAGPRGARAVARPDAPPRPASATGLRGRTRDWPRRPDPVAGPRDRPP